MLDFLRSTGLLVEPVDLALDASGLPPPSELADGAAAAAVKGGSGKAAAKAPAKPASASKGKDDKVGQVAACIPLPLNPEKHGGLPLTTKP